MFHRQKNEEDSSAPKNGRENNDISRIESREAEQKVPVPATESGPSQVENTKKQEEEKETMDNQNKETEQAQAQTQAPRSLDIPASGSAGFPQRPAASAPAPRYPGAYNAPTSNENMSEERKLLIGQGITMSGEIDSCDVLVVEGTVEASLRGARTLDIAESGMFYGAVEIDEAMISGRFEGDIVVNGRLTITSTGSITGSIAYREMAMEAGAMIDGRVSPLSAAGAAKAEKPRTRKASKDASAEKEADDTQLPLSGAAAAA